MTIAKWNINLYSAEAQEIFQRIQDEGVSVFRQQPGFVRYYLMRADSHTTIAVAEWESEELGLAGSQRYREWLRSSGIMQRLALETYAGDIVAAS
jgi:heme-degrading monooxygenase HmoA